jgi:peptide/nickel transport system substrate-binding protein
MEKPPMIGCPWRSAVLLVLVGVGGLLAADPPARQAAARTGPPGIEPFDPPPLAEIDAAAKWVDRPVLDGLELLRQHRAKQVKPLPVPEALKLRNTSRANNQKLVDALGTLPQNDSQVAWGTTWNRYLRGDVKSTNPILASSIEESDVLGTTGFGLFSFDWTMTPFAAKDTVVSWQSSADNLLDKVVMRKDLTWSDGRPLTAHDVVFSYQTIMDPEVPVMAQRSGTDKIRWVQAYDDQTLVFFHKEPLATNVWNVNFSVIPRHVYQPTLAQDKTLQKLPAHVELEDRPVSGGAYEIVSRSRNQEVVCRRRESWYLHQGKQVRDKPFFETIRYVIKTDPNTALLALKSGELDDLELNSEQWLSQTVGDDFYRRNTKVTGVVWLYWYFGWNNKSKFFSDRRVREAMSLAFDYEEMLQQLFGGLYEPCNGVFHPQSWMAPRPALPFYQQDLDKAEALLDAAGWEDTDDDGVRDKLIGGRRVPFEFSLIVRQDPERIKVCTLMRTCLDQIGIKCNISPLDATTMQSRMHTRDFAAAYGGWSTGADPDLSENVWATTGERNFVSYANREVDRLYVQGRQTFDQAERGRIYAQIHRLIYQDQPCTFLFFQNSFHAFNRQMRGYMISPRGPFNYSPGSGSVWKALD